jgi:hypothetical protein
VICTLWSKYAYSDEWKKHMYLSKENHRWYKHEHVAHWFPVRIELVCERNNSCNLGFEGGHRLSFFQIGLFSWVEETHVSLQWNSSVLEVGPSRTLFPCESWSILKGKHTATCFFQGGCTSSFFQICLFRWEEKTHVSLKSKLSVLRAGQSSTLFPWDSISFWREYFMKLWVF